MISRKTMLKNLKRQLPFTHALSKNEEGVAAIEFALIAPFMLALYFGMSEIALGITADRQVAHATSVAGDLATQVATINTDEMADVMTATLAVLGVTYDTVSAQKVTIELNSFQKDTDGTITRVGYAILGPPISAGGPADYDASGLSDQMLNDQSGIMVARINYAYEPVTLMFMKNVTLNETFLLKPRQSVTIPFDEDGKNAFKCSASKNLSVTCS